MTKIHKLNLNVSVEEVSSPICDDCYFIDKTPCVKHFREHNLPNCFDNEIIYKQVKGRPHFLLDQDGLLADFLTDAIKLLNRAYGKDITLEQYAKEFGQWGTYDYYGITVEQFWEPINNDKDFWINLAPMPWAKRLYSDLCALGDVTIVTTPSEDPDCSRQKLIWLRMHLGIKSADVFLGSKKYLMAGNGILIDDYSKNVDTFTAAGGQAILVPSTWNTNDLTYEMIWNTIAKELNG